MAQKRKDSNRIVLRKGESQRPNGTYVYSWYDSNHKRCYVYAKTINELREKEKEIDKAVDDYAANHYKKIRLNELFEQWKELKRGLRTNVYENYCYIYNAYVAPDFGRNYVTSIRKSDVRKFYNSLYDAKNLSLRTIDTINTIVRQVFEIAVDDGWLLSNPTLNVMMEMSKLEDSRSRDRTPLTLEQQQALLRYVQGHHQYKRWFPLIYILLNTGMRIGEAVSLRWIDVDMEKEIIDVNHNLVYYCHRAKTHPDECMYDINPPKTKAGIRQIPMLADVKKAFLMQKEYVDAQPYGKDYSVNGYTGFIFFNRQGKLLNYSTANSALKRIVRDYNAERSQADVIIPMFTCHSLRHTFATRMCEAGVNPKVVQTIMGHSSVNITLDIYTEASERFQRDEMKNLTLYLASNDMPTT